MFHGYKVQNSNIFLFRNKNSTTGALYKKKLSMPEISLNSFRAVLSTQSIPQVVSTHFYFLFWPNPSEDADK